MISPQLFLEGMEVQVLTVISEMLQKRKLNDEFSCTKEMNLIPLQNSRKRY